MIDLPPDTLKGYWCPACGRFELVRQTWHVRSGSIANRCEQREMTPITYEVPGGDWGRLVRENPGAKS